MRMIKNTVAAVILSALVAAPAFAGGNTVVVTDVSNSKAGRVVSLDLHSAGDMAAFQFALDLPAGAGNVNTSKCLSELPKGFTGLCQSKDNRVAAVIYSSNNTALPAGMTSLGVISFTGGQAKSGGITVSDMNGSSPSGTAATVASEVASDNGVGTQEK